MHSEIIAVGSELLSFGRIDTNSVHIASRLATLGISVRFKQVVGDRIDDISDALTLAAGRSDIVFVTGGLGPTTDDITREAVSRSLGRSLQEDPGVIREMELIYRKWGRSMAANNRRQALVPEGARVLANSNGTAPGLFLKHDEKLIFVLPGPPRELNPILEKDVIPILRELKNLAEMPSRLLKVASVSESALDARIEGIYRKYPEIDTTILASPGLISLYFIWNSTGNLDHSHAALDRLVSEVRDELGISVLTDRDEDLQGTVGRMLREQNLSLAVAESCTGGLIGKMLTDIPGSSEYFLGGVIAYSNSVKESMLSVNPEDLAREGAVSSVVAEQMAEGVRTHLNADLGLSITGVAGPGGGSKEKPVGTVYIGLSGEDISLSWNYMAVGGRDIVRTRSANLALDRLRRWLLSVT